MKDEQTEKKQKAKKAMIVLFKIMLNGLDTARLTRSISNQDTRDVDVIEGKIKTVIEELEKDNPDAGKIDAILLELQIKAEQNKAEQNKSWTNDFEKGGI